MINFTKFTLDNGLRVIVHQDTTTPLAVFNLLYDVGARDERSDRTGFAHLFEHLMFGGSENIPSFDEPLQMASGDNNAFTSNDITNYYMTLPAANLETAFWLESDRMNNLAFSQKSLDVQRNVVIEEFNERYLSQPYGDLWLLLRPLAYKVHPYQWATIGKSIDHVANASMTDVKNFFKKFYNPNNAILCVAGNVNHDQVKALTEKWFGGIQRGEDYKRNLPVEPAQTEARVQTVYKPVPYDCIVKCYHSAGRIDDAYYTEDLLTDVLSDGFSSRIYKELVKNKQLFSEVDIYLTGDQDKGLVIAEGKLSEGVSMEVAEAALDAEIAKMTTELISDEELEKVKNKISSNLMFAEMNVLNVAMNLCFAELMGDANMANEELEQYQRVTAEMIRDRSAQIFRKENSSTLYYLAEKK